MFIIKLHVWYIQKYVYLIAYNWASLPSTAYNLIVFNYLYITFNRLHFHENNWFVKACAKILLHHSFVHLEKLPVCGVWSESFYEFKWFIFWKLRFPELLILSSRPRIDGANQLALALRDVTQ